MKEYKDIDLAIDETFKVLEKYLGKDNKCLPVFRDITSKTDEYNKKVFIKLFNEFLNHYFMYYHPLKRYQDLEQCRSYYRQHYMKESQRHFKLIAYNYKDKKMCSYSMNIFKTFWKKELVSFN